MVAQEQIEAPPIEESTQRLQGPVCLGPWHEPEIMAFKAKLAQKKLKVIEATGSVPKNGRNTFNNYDYAMAADTFDIIRKALVAGIAFTAEVESVEITVPPKEVSKNINTKIWMRYTLTDTETGYSETVRWPGEANDTGDKGLYKAQTNCLKYFCFQTFMLPTGLDVEQETDDEKGLGNPPAGRKSYTNPAAPKKPAAPQAPATPAEKPMDEQIAEGLLGKEPDDIESDNALPPYNEKSKKVMDALFDYYKSKIADMEGLAFNALKLRALVFGIKSRWPETAVGATTIKSKIKPEEVADKV
jgi:hypothetical protein